jgi:hypothetical protein
MIVGGFVNNDTFSLGKTGDDYNAILLHFFYSFLYDYLALLKERTARWEDGKNWKFLPKTWLHQGLEKAGWTCGLYQKIVS